jgi:hypothetical protein
MKGAPAQEASQFLGGEVLFRILGIDQTNAQIEVLLCRLCLENIICTKMPQTA